MSLAVTRVWPSGVNATDGYMGAYWLPVVSGRPTRSRRTTSNRSRRLADVVASRPLPLMAATAKTESAAASGLLARRETQAPMALDWLAR